MARDDLSELIMGPIDDKYCDIFYFMAVFVLISMCLGICMILYTIITGPKVQPTVLLIWLSNIIVYFIVYFENRILYNMCKKIL